ncbi:MAG: hypothetical protein AAGJ46_21410 [Planctomycetota bacterium]
MRTPRVLATALVVTTVALCESVAAQQQPVYQRRAVARPEFRPPVRPPFGTQPGVVRPPVQRRPQRRAPTVESGSFQRPYPYHLDYYKQRYGGGYEPYFGNLYGSPAIVGTQPFGFSQYPQPAPVQPPLAAPGGAATTPTVVCPHCGQAVQLLWPAPQ